MVKCIVFDIDTTLTYETSWWKITKALGAKVKYHEAIFNSFKDNQLGYEEAKTQLLQLWKKTGNANKKFLLGIFSEIEFKKDAKEIIEFLKSKKILLCLITGGVDLYAKTVAERLNITNYYSNTELIWNQNDELIDFNYARDQGDKKLTQFIDFCKKHGIDPKNCYVVGDDENDIKLFQKTGHGIAVKSPNSHQVEPHAWKVITHLSEIKDLV